MIARQMTASRRNPIASMRRSSRMGGGDGMSTIADRLEMDLVTPPALDQAPAHARSSERLAEFERHAVALANRLIFVTINVALFQRWRQGPNALGPIMAIRRVGVHAAFVHQFKTRSFREANHRAFLHIAALFFKRAIHVLRKPEIGRAHV